MAVGNFWFLLEILCPSVICRHIRASVLVQGKITKWKRDRKYQVVMKLWQDSLIDRNAAFRLIEWKGIVFLSTIGSNDKNSQDAFIDQQLRFIRAA